MTKAMSAGDPAGVPTPALRLQNGFDPLARRFAEAKPCCRVARYINDQKLVVRVQCVE
jgi:hypothetical protein